MQLHTRTLPTLDTQLKIDKDLTDFEFTLTKTLENIKFNCMD